jgi:hypothetical protein
MKLRWTDLHTDHARADAEESAAHFQSAKRTAEFPCLAGIAVGRISGKAERHCND